MTIYNWASEGINDIYPAMVNECLHHGTTVTQRGLTTRELSPVVFQLEDPRKRLVTAHGRPVNVAFALAEVLWILAGRDDVDMLAAYNSRIADFSDDGRTFNAAYGYRLRHAFGHDQLEDCIAQLEADPGCRQAVLQINHPGFDSGFVEHADGSSSPRVTKDRACNVSSHMLLRDGRLNWTQFMRSNDAIWGTPYNVMQWTHVQEYVAARLGVELGTYTHVSDSFHIYDPPLDGGELPDVAYFDLYGAGRWGHHHMPNSDLSHVVAAEHQIRTTAARTSDLPFMQATGTEVEFWKPFIQLWGAHRHYVGGRDSIAYALCLHCADSVYGLAQLRFYVQSRWALNPGKYGDLLARMALDVPPDVADWMMGRREVKVG